MSNTSHIQVRARIREAEAVKLRLAGATYAEIAQALGYSGPGSAHKAVRRALERIFPREEAKAVLQLELARLDRLWSAIWPKAIEGDNAAIDRCLRIMERRAKLLGLDKPDRLGILDPHVVPLRWEDLLLSALDAGQDGGERW